MSSPRVSGPWHAIVWFVAAVAIGAYICPPIRDPDLGWHVVAGRWILANRALPSVDYWNLYGAGNPWTAYSWSNEIVYAVFDAWRGMEGLFILQLLLAILTVLSFFYFLGRLAGDWFLGALIGSAAAAATYAQFGLRPQTVVWIFLLAVISAADDIAREGFTRKRGLLLAAVMSLWANTHITTAIGLAAIGAWLFDHRRPQILARPLLWAFAGTLLTPYLGYEWVIFFSKTSHPISHSMIAEFGPATILEYATGLLLLLLALLAAFLFDKPKGTTPGRVGACVVLTIGALAVVKFLPFAALFAAAVICQMWRDVGGAEGPGLGYLGEAISKLREGLLKVSGFGLAFVFAALAVVNIRDRWRTPVDKRIVAVEAVDYIEREALDRPLLNSFGEGGYLMYRFADAAGNLDRKVTIDGRTNVNPPEISEAHAAAFQGNRNWRGYLEMTRPETVLWKNRSPFVSLLEATGEWCRVYDSGSEKSPTDGHSVFISRAQAARRGIEERCPEGSAGREIGLSSVR